MGDWVDIELNKKLFKNVDESAITSTFGALENAFVTEANGLSRWPGLKLFADLGGNADIHINKYGNDMIAVGTDGRTFRLDTNANETAIQGPPVLGGDRVSFAKTRNGLLMGAGSQIIKFDGVQNSILSADAPLSSQLGYLDGYAIAVERESGRFAYSAPNDHSSWPALSVQAVDGLPDDINGMLITPFNEILVSGEDSIEQYERYVGGDVPFFRRWSTGDGISEPGTLCYMDNAAWGLNNRYEFVRLSGQTSQSVSDDVQKEIEERVSLANLGSMTKSWASGVNIKGQKVIILQMPEVDNIYGTKGMTLVFDIRRGQFFEIFGWDAQNGCPAVWPGRSVFSLWGKTFIGGQGKIYELSNTTYNNDGAVQRAYVRTAHFDTLNCMSVNSIKMTLKRGVGNYSTNPKIMFRSNPDNKGFGTVQTRELGSTGAENFTIEFGAQGIADTWQFEWSITDDCPFEIRRLQANVTRVVR